MKLLIGGKNRNIHFRKDKSAFYKSNGEEHDVSKLFKKVGGLKKQYEEYLVSDNDLTERYKALSISGGSSSGSSKKKPVHDKPINKKKRKGKKFVGGMTVSALNIDIDAGGAAGAAGAAGADINSRFRVYLKLIGAYYLALLTESDSFIFGDTPEKIRDFHKNKLNNLLIIDFMENPRSQANRYLPYAERINNLYFCHQLLKNANAVVTVAFDAAVVTGLLNDASLNPGVVAVVAGTKYNQFLVAVGGGGGAATGPDIITDMLAYRLPAYDANNQIQAQFYRYIVADIIEKAVPPAVPPAVPAINDFIQNNLHDPGAGALTLNNDDVAMISTFEDRYVIAGGTVLTSVAAAAAAAAAATPAVIAVIAGANDELKKLPYELFEKLIASNLIPVAASPNINAVTTSIELRDAYYNTIQAAVSAAVAVAAANTVRGVAVVAGTGLFALSIP